MVRPRAARTPAAELHEPGDFPQVKIAHLCPSQRPPEGREREKARVAEIVLAVGPAGIAPESKQELDALVFALFRFADVDKRRSRSARARPSSRAEALDAHRRS
jgi:hypothetical protein